MVRNGAAALLVAWAGAAATLGQSSPPAAATAPLLARPANAGSDTVRGLAAAMAASSPRFPVLLSPADDMRRACATSCGVWDRLDLVMSRAASWLATFPTTDLGFDAAIMLSQIRDTVNSDALTLAFDRARAVADRDADHPQRAFWNSAATAPREHTAGWAIPSEPGKRVNVNYPLTEALYCRSNGWRAETTAYVCGPMRDDGGYQTTHALWALDLAFRRGCVTPAAFEACARILQAELAAAQASPFAPQATLDIDLYAERLLTVAMTGSADTAMNTWAATVMALQHSDGSWGIAKEGEAPFWQYHATAISTWALAEWYRRMVGSPALRPQ